MKSDGKERLYGMLGFAMRAGRIVIGTELVCVAMAKNKKDKPKLILVSSYASDLTKKKVKIKSEFYSIEALEIDIDAQELGRLLGKACAPMVLGITDERFAEEIRRAILPQT